MINKKITTTVIDNWLEPQLSDYLSSYLFNGIFYKTGHGSNIGDVSFLFGDVSLNPLILAFKTSFLL